MKIKESLLQDKIRADAYKLLSECFYLPDDKLINLLKNIDTSMSTFHAQLAKTTPAPEDIELLKVDYSRLFVGPFKLLAPPYGSVYLEGERKIMGNSSLDVRDRYTEEGLNNILREAPDHIAIELEFMYFLICKKLQAAKESDFDAADIYLKKQIAFLKMHLGAWIPEFSRGMKTNAQYEFYKNLAEITSSFVEKDLENLIYNNS